MSSGESAAAAENQALKAEVVRQQAIIDALVEAAERRLDRPSDESTFGHLERNLVLLQEVENRTQRVRAGERLLRSVVDSLESRICILGEHAQIVGTNRLWDTFAAQMGWSEDESGVGGDFFVLLRRARGELFSLLSAAVHETLGADAEQTSVKGYLSVPGRTEHVVVRMHPIRDHESARLVVTMVDITEATRTQQELRRVTDEAQLLALVAQHTDNGVLITDANGHIEWVNAAFCRMSGYTSSEVIGLSRLDLIAGPYATTPMFDKVAAAISSGQSAELTLATLTKDGASYWVHVEIQPVIEDGQVARFVSVERDVTAQRALDERLRAATRQAKLLAEQLSVEKTLLSEVLASIPHLVYWKDQNLRYTGVNQAFLSIRALDPNVEVLERTEEELGVGDELTAALADIEPAVLVSGSAVDNQRLLLTGANRPACSLLLSVLPRLGEDGQVCGVIGVAADVTHVSTLEQQLAQATRLESIGQLAAGIAHEINTPVQYVSDNTQFLITSFAEVLDALRAVRSLGASGRESGELLRRLDEIDLDYLAEEIPSALIQSQEGLTRIGQIVRAMKDFSHPGQGRSEADLNRMIESTVQVSRNEWRYVCELHLDLSPDVGLVTCYEGELKQVLLNIVVNAAQAITTDGQHTGSHGLGCIRIRSERLPDAVRIVISDDGPGMSAEVKRKVFDPFFTTKPVGKGTGQGLSMAYAVIVQKHGGEIEVESAPGQGATFTITLPQPTTPW
jgi:two-component system, NtrC family, sensor kinase